MLYIFLAGARLRGSRFGLLQALQCGRMYFRPPVGDPNREVKLQRYTLSDYSVIYAFHWLMNNAPTTG